MSIISDLAALDQRNGHSPGDTHHSGRRFDGGDSYRAGPHAQDDPADDAGEQDEGSDDGGEKKKPKKSQADRLVELARESGIVLFHSPGGDPEAYATVPIGDHRATMRVASKAFRSFLCRQLWIATAKAPAAQALQDALGVLAGQALYEGAEHPVAVRLAEHQGMIYLDLADAEWRAVRVSADGWEVVSNPPVRFVRPRGVLPLPVPERGGTIDDLRPFVNVATDDDFTLLVACIISYMRPRGPFPVMAVYGEQGSAKSTTTRVIRECVDPNASPLRSEPREPRDLMIAAANGWIVTAENLSSIPVWLSDSLCRLSTGGGFSTRELYSDGEEKLFDAQRPVIVNGITEVVARPDLADRAVAITLPTIPEERRTTEADFWQRFREAQPRILGALLDLVSGALRRLPETKLDRLPRMADFALWGTAALGDHFMVAYSGNRQSLNETALEACPIVSYMAILLDQNQGVWQGTAAQLLETLDGLATDDVKRQKGWPGKGHVLSGMLRRVAPNLRQAGIDIRSDRTGRARKLTITRTERENSVTSVTKRHQSGISGIPEGVAERHPSVTRTPPSVTTEREASPSAVECPEKTGGSDAGDAGDAPIPSYSGSPVLPQEITHKAPGCTSREWWEHVDGTIYCAQCWPCRDDRAKEREGVAI